jgi:tetratricopeptide (TPR) repeat protein
LELNEVILKACESDPRNRYLSAQEMQADLALLQRGESVKQARTRKHRLGMVKKLALAAGVVTLLGLTISYWKPLHSGYTPKPEAQRLYDDGRWYYSKLTPDDHEKAFKYLSEAVETDPKFLQPYDELTILFGWARIPWVTNEQVRLEQTKKIEDKLLAIAPQSAERHTASSLRRFLERDWRGAEDEIVQAIRLKPDSAVAHDIYCFYLSMQGRIDEAKRIGHRAQELEPPYSRRVTAIFASWPFLAERRFDLSIAQVQRVLELDQKFTSGYLYLGDCYEAQSNYLAAIEAYEKTADLWMEKDRARINAIFQALREAYHTGGERGYFRKRIELALADRALPESEQLLRNFSTWDTAGYYARLGENEKALDELTAHFDEVHVWQQIKFRPLYDTLHHHPRFKELVKRAGLEP